MDFLYSSECCGVGSRIKEVKRKDLSDRGQTVGAGQLGWSISETAGPVV